MNRRSFIGTITALAGLALAKIKAPAKSAKLMRPGVTRLVTQEPLTAVHKFGDDLLIFTRNRAYRYTPKEGGWVEVKRVHFGIHKSV